MCLDRLLFLSNPLMFKSSTITAWLSPIILLLSLCKKSFLWFTTFSCSFATFLWSLRYFPFPFIFLDNFLWSFLSLFSVFNRFLGFSIFSPVDKVQKWVSPTSIATTLSVSGSGSTSLSTRTLKLYQATSPLLGVIDCLLL